MRRAKYYRLCTQMPTAYLHDCLASPSQFMARKHLAIIALVLRHRGAL